MIFLRAHHDAPRDLSKLLEAGIITMALHLTPVELGALALLAACSITPSSAEPAAMGGQKMVIYGNYCGPGNNAPLPPIDDLDAACARHDACTPSRGLPTKACNLRLAREAEAVALDPSQPDDLRALAGAVAAFAVATPSTSYSSIVPEEALALGARMLFTAPR